MSFGDTSLEPPPPPTVLFERHTPLNWINVNSHFLSTTFCWSLLSSKTGSNLRAFEKLRRNFANLRWKWLCETWSRFHQHFTRQFFCTKANWAAFLYLRSALKFSAAKKVAHKMLMKLTLEIEKLFLHSNNRNNSNNNGNSSNNNLERVICYGAPQTFINSIIFVSGYKFNLL